MELVVTEDRFVDTTASWTCIYVSPDLSYQARLVERAKGERPEEE